MNRSLAAFLQAVVTLAGIAVLTFLLWEPHVEGRNVNATNFEIYFHDPFLAFVYLGSVPFFVGVFKTFRLLGGIRHGEAFSQATVDALRLINHCAIIVIAFAIGGFFLAFLNGDPDDRPVGFVMSFFVGSAAGVTALAASAFGRRVRESLARSTENSG